MVRVLLLMGAVLGSGVVAAAEDILAAYRWKARIVVISAPSADDPLLLWQRARLAERPGGVGERDIVVVEAVGDAGDAPRLRARLGLPDTVFRVVLVGKDGAVKRTDDRPLSAEALFDIIDAMPMRRDEMRRR